VKLQRPTVLTPECNLKTFNSGVESLDRWLRHRAIRNQLSGASRTYVVSAPENRVVGYYALASGALAHTYTSGQLKRNMPDPIPMAVLGRLAVDRSMQRKGLGVALLKDAVLRVQQAASIVGIRGIIVHAISKEAQTFYEYHGFKSSIGNPRLLILSIPR